MGRPPALRDRTVRAIASLKHSLAARMAMLPAMNVYYLIRDACYWHSADARHIRQLKDTHRGERCFVLGNGPSLTTGDLDLLVNEVTFAANRIYALFPRTPWRPTFYLATDREFIAQEAQTFMGLPIGHALINVTPFSRSLRGAPNITLINKRPSYFSSHKYTTRNITFSNHPDRFVAEGYTVTYVAIQLALYMGFREIVLLGMDHTYATFVGSDGRVHTRDDVANHCYDDPVGAIINPQYVEGVEYAYRLANDKARRRGVRIVNATPGGMLEVFERVSLDEVLGGLVDMSMPGEARQMQRGAMP